MAAVRAAADGVTRNTSAKADTYWRYWVEFLHAIELQDDPFLTEFEPMFRLRTIAAFANTVRECTYSRSTKGYDRLVANTCRAAVDAVAKAFTAHNLPDPTAGPNGKLAFLLQRQLRGYKNNDPGTKHQKCLPLEVIQTMVQRDTSSIVLIVFHQLMLLGFFYAMRSCENFKVSGERRTHPLRKRNLTFIKNHRIIPHDSPLLEHADALAITFEYQKRDERDETITQQKTDHHLLCPVKIGAKIVRRMQAQGASDDTFLYEYIRDSDGKKGHLTGPQALTLLRDFIWTIDYESLGIHPNDIGLHSLRSSAAMAMYLNGVPVYTIMLLGRWSSDAFLRYIRKQVEEFGHDVSR